MHFSPPVSSSPTPPAPKASNGCHAGAIDATAKKSTEPTGDSFESLLHRDSAVEQPADEKKGSDQEQTAEILAALFWQPALPVEAPVPLAVGAPATEIACDGADTSVCFAAKTSRAFTPILSGSVPDSSLAALPANPALPANHATPAAPCGSPQIPETLMRSELISTRPAKHDAAHIALTPSVGVALVPAHVEDAAKVALVLPVAAQPLMPVQAHVGLTGGTQTDASAVDTKGGPTPLLEVTNALTAISTVNRNVPALKVPVAPLGTTVGAVVKTLPELFSKVVGEITDGLNQSTFPSVVHAVVETIKDAKQNFVQENIAAARGLLDAAPEAAPVEQGKYFLDAGRKLVTSVGTSVGISVAKVNAAMSAAANARQKVTSISESVSAFSFSTEMGSVATFSAQAPAPVATVRETLAAVISAVEMIERQSEVQQKTVDLNFQVGGEKLGLRVELREGVVHTTFRTESAEMNSALAHEWHHVVHPVGARDMRLAEPVYSSAVPASGESSSGLLGQGTPHQREPKAHQAAFASTLKHESYEAAVPESAAKVAPSVNSSQLLNVLA